MLKINGTSVKTPSKFQVDFYDIDGETHRNARGEMIRDRIATKRKLNCEWSVLTQTETSTLLNAVRNTFFNVEYWDPLEGLVTKTFYVGDRQMPMLRIKNGVPIWEGLTMNFIEK